MTSPRTTPGGGSSTDEPAPRPEEGKGPTEDAVRADEVGAKGHAADNASGPGDDDRFKGYVPV